MTETMSSRRFKLYNLKYFLVKANKPIPTSKNS
eukprot:UN20160